MSQSLVAEISEPICAGYARLVRLRDGDAAGQLASQVFEIFGNRIFLTRVLRSARNQGRLQSVCNALISISEENRPMLLSALVAAAQADSLDDAVASLADAPTPVIGVTVINRQLALQAV